MVESDRNRQTDRVETDRDGQLITDNSHYKSRSPAQGSTQWRLFNHSTVITMTMILTIRTTPKPTATPK